MPDALLALLQAIVALLPALEDALPSIEAVFNGTADAADLTAIEGVTTALNTQAASAEAAAGATGPTS